MNTEPSNEQPVEDNRPPEVSPDIAAEQISAAPAETSQPGFPPAAETPEVKEKSFWQKSLRWVLVVLLSLAIGFALGFFLLYMPANNALSQAKIDLADTKGALELVDTKAADLQAGLSDANAQVKTSALALDSAKIDIALARMQANISYARLALINKDTLTARQELSDADANLANLTLLINDRETSSTLADRLKNIRADLSSDPSKALEELRILSENLDRLGNR